MRHSHNLAPVMESLEPRQLLSASIPVQSVAAARTAPGSQVIAQVVTSGAAKSLYVLGTNGADTVTVSQVSGVTSVRTPTAIAAIAGTFTSITLYGFAGNDVLTVCWLVTTRAFVYAGAGNDAVYDLGQGSDKVYGEAGNDLLVSIGGGADRASGGGGTDSFWADASDTIADATRAENSLTNVHRVGQFLGGVSMQCNGQNLADPALASYATRYANFASKPLFTNGPSYADIQQGALGDCYFLASLGAIASANPNAIRQMITSLGDGTYAVRFYRKGQPVYLRIDADLPVTRSGSLAYAKLSGSGESWAPLAEKAYAFFRTGANSYGSLSGGWMATVCTEVLNRSTAYVPTTASDSALYSSLSKALSAKRAVTAGSRSNASGPVVGSHAYVVRQVYQRAGQMYLVLYNPWGVDGTKADSNPNDGLITLTMARFKQYFSAAVAA